MSTAARELMKALLAMGNTADVVAAAASPSPWAGDHSNKVHPRIEARTARLALTARLQRRLLHAHWPIEELTSAFFLPAHAQPCFAFRRCLVLAVLPALAKWNPIRQKQVGACFAAGADPVGWAAAAPVQSAERQPGRSR